MSFLWSETENHVDSDIASRKAIDNLGVSKMDVWQAVGREALLDNPEQLLANIAKIKYQQRFNQNKLSPEQFEQQYGSSGLEYDPNMTEELAEYLLARKKQREINEYIIARGEGGFFQTACAFGTAILAGFASPAGIALSFVPIGGQLRWAKIARRYGRLASVAAKGATSAAAFQAGLEPAIAYSRNLEQRDYGAGEALTDIAIAAAFGAMVGSLGYGAGKLKQKFLDSNLQTKKPYNTGNPLIDNEFEEAVHQVAGKPLPEATDLPLETLEELQQQKLDLFNQYKTKMPELFEQSFKEAHLRQQLQESFITGGNDEYIPDHLLAHLHEEQKKTATVQQQYLDNPDYQAYLATKKLIDAKITERLKYHQQQEKAYDLSPEKLYTAAQQLQEGKHIDLDHPMHAQSIYETGRNPEVLEHPAQSEQQDKFENILAFVTKHKSRKIGFKELLRQTELRQQTISRELLCGLMTDLEKQELTKFFTDKHFQADIARELHNLTSGNHPQGYTGSKKALQIAKIVYHWQGKAISRANSAGAEIVPLPGYITRQMHAPRALKTMGYQEWHSFILPLLDLKKTGDIDFKRVFDALATGLHLDEHSEYFKGGGNLAKAVSESRKLHFKSADHWLEYNAKCGQYNLSDSILLNLRNIGHATGLMDVFGNNPQHNFDRLKNAMLQELRDKAAAGNKRALKETQYFQSTGADDIFRLLIGHNAPEIPALAAISSGIRVLKTTSSLGSIVLSSLPDMATWVAELGNNGIPILKGYYHVLTDLVAALTSKEKREFARVLGIASENTLGIAYTRLNADYPALGHLSKLSNLFFKLNLMEWWDSSFKSSMGLILSNNLAEQVYTRFSELPSVLQNQLARYDIDFSNWSLYGHLVQKVKGNRYLIPDGQLLPDAALKEYLVYKEQKTDEAAINALRHDLINNLRRYFLDRVDTAMITSHAAEQAIVFAGTKRGTWLGEFVRFFMQFKTFPISYIVRPLQASTLDRIPVIERTGVFTKDMLLAMKNPGTITAMTHLLIGTTVFGYLSMCARSLLKGQPLPDPEDGKVWTAAVIKGGGLGIFGDFIFNEYDRYGRTFLQETAGPVFGDINSVASILSKYKEGKLTKAQQEAWQLFLRNVPFQNLFYLQPAINIMRK